jgi:hypothetical protein
MRARFTPEVSAWALTQVGLRRKAATKLGERAGGMYLSARGLEQATRTSVGDWRAARLRDLGVPGVIDLTAGLGADAMAFAAAGLQVVAVERDAETARYLAHNLGASVGAGSTPDAVGAVTPSGTSIPQVIVGDAVELAADLIAAHPEFAVYLDPARRTSTGRSWRLADLTPPWEFVTGLLAQDLPVVVKLGPGFPLESIPDGVEACWVSDQGDLVECSLWPGSSRSVVALRAGASPQATQATPATATCATATTLPIHLHADTLPEPLPVAAPRAYIVEPDPAVIRSGLAPLLADALGSLTALSAGIAYLSSDTPLTT